MAKSKQDYIDLGYKNRMDFHAKGGKVEDLPVPDSEKVKSWQDTAYNVGWAKAEGELKLIADCEANGCGLLVKSVETEDGVDVAAWAKSDFMPAPVMEHVKHLRMESLTCSLNEQDRAARLIHKANKLEAKYAQRAARV